jgi:hypothetical protein
MHITALVARRRCLEPLRLAKEGVFIVTLRRSFLRAPRALILLGLLACGGGAAGEVSPKAVPSVGMPAYPPAPQSAKPKDAKAICAGARDVKISSREGRRTGLTLRDDQGGFSSDHSKKAYEPAPSMADLRAASKNSDWELLLWNADKVAPAQRGADWAKLVEKAAIGYMQEGKTNTAPFAGVYRSQESVERYPHLLESPEFVAKRAEAGKRGTELCLRNERYRWAQTCIDGMKYVLKVTNADADVGFAFGKMTCKNRNHDEAVPFFKWALDQKKDAAMCGDEDLASAVLAGLGLHPNDENAGGARTIAANACWDSLKVQIEKRLIEDASSDYRDNACAVMKAKGAL